MSRIKNSLAIVLPTVVTGALLFGVLSTKEENKGAKLDYTQVLESSPSMKYVSAVEYIDTEFNRLKEEERKRIEAEQRRIEAERQARLKAIAEEKARKAEEERKRQLAIKAEEEKKRQQQVAVSRGGEGETGWMNYQFTHYTAYCPEGCTGVSATGDYLGGSEYYNGYRVVAAPKNIPFYSIVRIQYPDGTQFDAIVLDRGGAIKGNLLDVLVSSESKARQLGRINGKMKIIKYGG